MTSRINPFTQPGRWYKANLHTHTTRSDGRATVAERLAQYRRAGYHILALTDHRATHDVAGLSRPRFLVLSGMEFHPPCRREKTLHHLVALGVPHGLAFSRPASANRCIAEVHRAGGIVVLAHPYWTGLGGDAIRGLRGLDAVEVYNTTCTRIGRAASESEWAFLLDHGWTIPAVAVDDTHGADAVDVCESATWLKLPALTVAHVLRAVRTGCGYATNGPRLLDFRVADGRVRLRCTPAQSGQFQAGPARGASCWAAPGRPLTACAVPVQPGWPYVRAVVTDARGRQAWTNPIPLG